MEFLHVCLWCNRRDLTSHRPLWSYGFDKDIISIGPMVKGNETHSLGYLCCVDNFKVHLQNVTRIKMPSHGKQLWKTTVMDVSYMYYTSMSFSFSCVILS